MNRRWDLSPTAPLDRHPRRDGRAARHRCGCADHRRLLDRHGRIPGRRALGDDHHVDHHDDHHDDHDDHHHRRPAARSVRPGDIDLQGADHLHATTHQRVGTDTRRQLEGWSDSDLGPHTIAGGEIQFHEIPNGTNGVKAIPAGDWTNSYKGTASTPKTDCPPPDTTSTTTTTTTTAPPTTTSSTTTTTLPPPTTTTVAPPASASSGGISSANADTVIRSIDWNISRARQVCTVANVTGIDGTPRAWAIRIDLTASPWNRTAPSQIDLNGTGTVTLESPSSVLITGRSGRGAFNPRFNNTPITNTQTAAVTICNYNSPVPPPADPSWYSVTTAQGTWTDTQACVVVTVTASGLATDPFFYGWTTSVDLTAAKARISGAGRTLNFVGWSPYPNGIDNYAANPVAYQPPLDSYTLTSGFDFALRGGVADSKTATICVNGY